MAQLSSARLVSCHAKGQGASKRFAMRRVQPSSELSSFLRVLLLSVSVPFSAVRLSVCESLSLSLSSYKCLFRFWA